MTDLDDIGMRLRQEGRSQNPAFSPVVHDRIMCALRQRGLEPDGPADLRARWIWRIAVPVGLAASLALVTWLFLRTGYVAPKPDQQIAAPPVLSDPPQLVENRPEPGTAMALLDEGRYAYLDRDVQRLMYFVARQLPEFAVPSPDKP